MDLRNKTNIIWIVSKDMSVSYITELRSIPILIDVDFIPQIETLNGGKIYRMYTSCLDNSELNL